MELYVYQGDNRDLIGIVSLYSNFRAVWRFDEPGEFTLRIPLDGIKGLRAFEPGLWLWPQGAREIFIIETVTLSQTEAREEAELTGRTASALLARRVIPDTTIGKGTHGQLIAGLVESVFSQPERTFPGLTVDIDTTMGDTIQYQPQAGSLLDAVQELCQGAALGFETLFDPVGKGLTFRVYQARDLSVVGQGLTVVFDPEYENITDYEFSDSIEDMANIAYVITGTDETTGVATKVCVAAPNYDADGNAIDAETAGYQRFETLVKHEGSNTSGGEGGKWSGGGAMAYPSDDNHKWGYWYEPRNEWTFGNWRDDW
jgi:hypothetical protein